MVDKKYLIDENDLDSVSGGLRGADNKINVVCPRCQAKFQVPAPGKYTHHCGAKLNVSAEGIATAENGDLLQGKTLEAGVPRT